MAWLGKLILPLVGCYYIITSGRRTNPDKSGHNPDKSGLRSKFLRYNKSYSVVFVDFIRTVLSKIMSKIVRPGAASPPRGPDWLPLRPWPSPRGRGGDPPVDSACGFPRGSTGRLLDELVTRYLRNTEGVYDLGALLLRFQPILALSVPETYPHPPSRMWQPTEDYLCFCPVQVRLPCCA
jgi:hypothetical protein